MIKKEENNKIVHEQMKEINIRKKVIRMTEMEVKKRKQARAWS